MNITAKDVAKYRLHLKTQIADVLIDLGWTQAEVAKRYGQHVKQEPYTEQRISQLVNCNRGEEAKSEQLLNWLKEQVPLVAV